MGILKNKKVLSIIKILLAVIVILKIYNLYTATYQIRAIRSMGFQYSMDKYRENKDKISPFPEFVKNFIPDKSIDKDLFPFCARYAKLNKAIATNDKYSIEECQKYYNIVKNKVSVNLNDYKNDLIPEITSFLNKEKTFVFPTFEDTQNLLPSQDIKEYDKLAEYWVIVSKIFEEQNDYTSSLILRYGIIYLLYDFETNYSNSLDPFDELYLVETACNSILQWASEPKTQDIELSKKISKDLLNFASNDYKFSQYIEHRKKRFLAIIDHSISIKGTFCSILIDLEKSNLFKKAIRFMYDEPMEYIDKPYNEIKDKLENFKKAQDESKKYYEDATKWSIFSPKFIFFTGKTVYECIINEYSFSIDYSKQKYEHKLAYLEFTAIALAINAYYSEHNKMPDNYEDLNKWLGFNLPKNRFTDKYYEISKKNPVLFNPGILPEHPIPELIVNLFLYDKNDENERQRKLEWLSKLKKELFFYYIPIKEVSKQ